MDYGEYCVSLPGILIMWPIHLFYGLQTHLTCLMAARYKNTTPASGSLPALAGRRTHSAVPAVCLLCLVTLPLAFVMGSFQTIALKVQGSFDLTKKRPLSHREHFSLQATSSTQQSAALNSPAICCFAVPEKIKTPQLTADLVVKSE